MKFKRKISQNLVVKLILRCLTLFTQRPLARYWSHPHFRRGVRGELHCYHTRGLHAQLGYFEAACRFAMNVAVTCLKLGWFLTGRPRYHQIACFSSSFYETFRVSPSSPSLESTWLFISLFIYWLSHLIILNFSWNNIRFIALSIP